MLKISNVYEKFLLTYYTHKIGKKLICKKEKNVVKYRCTQKEYAHIHHLKRGLANHIMVALTCTGVKDTAQGGVTNTEQ